MDSVAVDATSSDQILLVVNTSDKLPISKDALSRSTVLSSLRAPLSSGPNLEVIPGYIQTWYRHVNRDISSKQICSSTDTTDSLTSLLQVCSSSNSCVASEPVGE